MKCLAPFATLPRSVQLSMTGEYLPRFVTCGCLIVTSSSERGVTDRQLSCSPIGYGGLHLSRIVVLIFLIRCAHFGLVLLVRERRSKACRSRQPPLTKTGPGCAMWCLQDRDTSDLNRSDWISAQEPGSENARKRQFDFYWARRADSTWQDLKAGPHHPMARHRWRRAAVVSPQRRRAVVLARESWAAS
jgi:hypothetical protein